MEIRIVDSTGAAHPRVREFTRARIERHFHRLRSGIRRVVVRLGDVNGRRRGRDKRVSLEVLRYNGIHTRLTECATSFLPALARAIRKAKRYTASGRISRTRIGRGLERHATLAGL